MFQNLKFSMFFRMKPFSKLLVRELQAELTAREIEFHSKDKKAILQKVKFCALKKTLSFFQKLKSFFAEKYPNHNLEELDFSSKIRFFDFENEERSGSTSREGSFDEGVGEKTILEEDLTMTPNKELKKAQVNFNEIFT